MRLRKTQAEEEPSIPIRRLADALAQGQTAGQTKPLAIDPNNINPHSLLVFGDGYLVAPWLRRIWQLGFDQGRAQRIADLQIACGEIAQSGAEGNPA